MLALIKKRIGDDLATENIQQAFPCRGSGRWFESNQSLGTVAQSVERLQLFSGNTRSLYTQQITHFKYGFFEQTVQRPQTFPGLGSRSSAG